VSGGTARLPRSALRLVAVTDSLRDGIDGLVARTTSAVSGGATMVQLRLKDEGARTLVEVARRLRAAVPDVPLLVNGRADVALAAGADGVHLGTDDLSPAALRRVVADGFVIGASIGDVAALGSDLSWLDDADYLAVGPVFVPGAGRGAGRGAAPAVGLERLARLAAAVAGTGCPLLALGGITLENAASVVEAGASGVAVISGLVGVPDPMRRARAFRDVLDASGR
jgi:thiamine-phosphate pyrophosphorylase